MKFNGTNLKLIRVQVNNKSLLIRIYFLFFRVMRGSPDRVDYTVQLQLRFCLYDNSSRQPDCFPSGIAVKVNGMAAQLPVRIRNFSVWGRQFKHYREGKTI